VKDTKMKAILHTKYGPADELQLKEVKKPIPKPNEVLIKIHATTVTSSDCNVRNFTFVPTMFKLPAGLFMFGVFKPRINILGFDLAGEIEEVGSDVTKFNIGDHVFGTPGTTFGAHAQYTCMPDEGVLTIKPENVSWEQAASVFLAGHTALYFLRDLGNIQAGQKVLINGASGGIGTFAVQLAKYYGAEVTGVCSTTNLEMVKSLGSDYVIDYTQEDFTKNGIVYDYIFDVVGAISFSSCKNSLKPDGVYLVCLMKFPDLVSMIWASIRGGRKIKGGPAPERIEDLIFLKELLENGKLKSIIDRYYPLEQTVEAFKYVEKGHKKGNVVITIDHDNDVS
jgi:NADPH:quinone reductase-like Zn-dependent oxidoreductase